MLSHFNVYHLRNLQAVSIDCHRCNVFIGKNGSGKTSLLESLHLLSRGKSFRHAQPKRYISHHQPTATVYAKFDDLSTMALQKAQDASTQMRLDGQTVYVQSALARQLPTLLIDPSSMDILETGSSQRRQLLDWITFHVEPNFHPQWVAYQRLLKQRNALLRQSTGLTDLQKKELKSWDKGLSQHADLITHYRSRVFEAWHPLFDQLITQLLPDYAPFIQLRFAPGYNTDEPFDVLLDKRIEQDHQLGYTRIGCHRADVQVLWVDSAETRPQADSSAVSVTDAEIEHKITIASPLDNSDDLNTVNELSSMDALDSPVDLEGTADLSSTMDLSSTIDLSSTMDLDSTANLSELDESNVITEITQNTLADETVQIKTNISFAPLKTLREQATNVLSRGEKKLLITALRLSQLPLLTRHIETISSTTKAEQASVSSEVNTKTTLPLVLLDDITAELDDKALSILLKTLAQTPCQLFITSLDRNIVDKLNVYWQDLQVFHVEHGVIIPVE